MASRSESQFKNKVSSYYCILVQSYFQLRLSLATFCADAYPIHYEHRVKTGLHLPETTAPGNTKDFPLLSTPSLICHPRYFGCLM